MYRTNFEINSFICSKDITGVPKLPIWSRDPGHASFGDSVVNAYERVYDATFFPAKFGDPSFIPLENIEKNSISPNFLGVNRRQF